MRRLPLGGIGEGGGFRRWAARRARRVFGAGEGAGRPARLRGRIANASVKTAFLLYAAAGILAALVLSFAVTGVLGSFAESTLAEDPYAYTGTYLYDAESRALVPAEALSWYERSAYDAARGASDAGGGAEGGLETPDPSEAVVLYIESHAYARGGEIPVDDPPAGAHDGMAIDIALAEKAASAAGAGGADEGRGLAFADIPAYDAAAGREGASASVSSRGLPLFVEADAAAVLRVADNLASNAARHARFAVEVELAWEDGVLTLSVADDGPGFGGAAGRALEPFWRGEGERLGSSGGSGGHMGLGLYVGSVLCSRHGGSLAVGDREGGGAVATATFAAPRCGRRCGSYGGNPRQLTLS